MTIRQKLIASFGTILFFLLIVSTISLLQMNQNRDVVTTIKEQNKTTALYEDIAFLTVRANAAVRGYMLYGAQPMRDNHLAFRQELHVIIDTLAPYSKDDAAFQQFVEDLTYWETTIDEHVFANVDAGNLEEAKNAALAVLGEDSKKLVSFGNEMAKTSQEETQQLLASIETSSQSAIWKFLLTVLVAVALSYIIARQLARFMNRNITAIATEMNMLARGDLNTRLQLQTRDEFAQIETSFNEMAQSIGTIVSDVQTSSEQVAATAQQLTASSHEVGHATDTVAQAMQQISNGIDEQHYITNDVQHRSSDMLREVGHVHTRLNEVRRDADSTNTLSSEGAEKLRLMFDQVTTIASNTSQLAKQMHVLDRQSNTIAKAVQQIQEIADQTNLIALNASIEAARAGEHGAGFAVVAQEVRTLADESSRSASDIQSIVQQMVNDTKEAVQQIERNEQAVTEGETLAHETNHAFTSIDEAIQRVQQQIIHVNDAMQTIHETTNTLVDKIETIHTISIDSTENVQNIAASTEQQSAAMTDITNASEHLSNMALTLQTAVQNFQRISK